MTNENILAAAANRLKTASEALDAACRASHATELALEVALEEREAALSALIKLVETP